MKTKFSFTMKSNDTPHALMKYELLGRRTAERIEWPLSGWGAAITFVDNSLPSQLLRAFAVGWSETRAAQRAALAMSTANTTGTPMSTPDSTTPDKEQNRETFRDMADELSRIYANVPMNGEAAAAMLLDPKLDAELRAIFVETWDAARAEGPESEADQPGAGSPAGSPEGDSEDPPPQAVPTQAVPASAEEAREAGREFWRLSHAYLGWMSGENAVRTMVRDDLPPDVRRAFAEAWDEAKASHIAASGIVPDNGVRILEAFDMEHVLEEMTPHVEALQQIATRENIPMLLSVVYRLTPAGVEHATMYTERNGTMPPQHLEALRHLLASNAMPTGVISLGSRPPVELIEELRRVLEAKISAATATTDDGGEPPPAMGDSPAMGSDDGLGAFRV